MKATRPGLVGGILVAMVTVSVQACPHCNIFNYLARTVRESKHIYRCEVVRQVDERTAQVRVLLALKGDRAAGEVLNIRLFGANEELGKKFIVCDPGEPGFEIVPAELEDEVQFLIPEKRSVHNIKDAIKRAQGVSVETQKVGMDYLKQHHAEAVEPLLAELKELMPKVFSTEEEAFGEHRLEKLAEALLLEPTDAGREFALAHIDGLAKREPEAIEWGERRIFESSRGMFLKDLLKQAQRHPDLSADVNARLDLVYPKLTGRALAEASYAAILSGARTPEALRAKLDGEDAVDMLALGLHLSGQHEAGWWQHARAKAYWKKALEMAKRKELTGMIEDRIRVNERFGNRK